MREVNAGYIRKEVIVERQQEWGGTWRKSEQNATVAESGLAQHTSLHTYLL